MAAEAHSHEHVHGAGHDHDHDAYLETGATDAYVRRSYVPVRLACLGIAVFFGLVGAIGLGRMGIEFSNVTDQTTEVFGLGMTQLLAMIMFGIGAISLVATGIGPTARSWMMLLGPVLLAAGVVVLIRPGILGDWLAMNRINGIAYIVAGGVAVATVIGTPITWMRRERDIGTRGALTA